MNKSQISIIGSSSQIGEDRVFVIADIGKNFIDQEEKQDVSVYLEKAKRLIDAAVWARVDAVKFQTHEVEDEQASLHVISPHFKAADRHSWLSWNTEVTPLEFWQEIKAYTEKKGTLFFSTPMSRKAAMKLEAIDVPFWKVGSGDVEDYLLLDFLISTKKPIIISTGMVSREELDRVVRYVQGKGSPLVILYCVSKYPCEPEDFNLASIEYLKDKYPEAVIGFSDHSIDGHEVDLAAIKFGARVIEKHFSFDRKLWGADHKVSLTPEEMKNMITDIRAEGYRPINHDKFYGDKEKEFEGANNQFRDYFKKTLVAGSDIEPGAAIDHGLLYALRPQKYLPGFSSNRVNEVIGRTVKQKIKKYQPIKEEDLD